MCYVLILSTTSTDDLSRFNNDGIHFDGKIPDHLPVGQLRYSNRWYVGSRSGCSCSFRHLYGPEFGFGISEDWYPEEQSDIDATIEFVQLVRALILKGEHVDCIDAWDSQEALEPVASLAVNLSKVRDDEFRFFENHHFDFVLG